ncbi:hypothetical protein SO802_020521 [Lithocarpus litseifolius]|uniref:Beta-catenin-like protein 1 N-terminal domain-containing protein n=1 Tax=Lithocarpus litseifolius TaxID=425828 RepID=A0AAW2CHH1_9ROSI
MNSKQNFLKARPIRRLRNRPPRRPPQAHILVGAPELYPDLVNLNAIPSILNLLAHDNTDITVDVVQLLQDLTDPDVFEDNEESDEPARVLVDELVENNVLELLVQNLQRLNDSDPDEMAAVYSTLTTVENLVEVKLAVAEMVCERTKLLKWLLGKIKVREFDFWVVRLGFF